MKKILLLSTFLLFSLGELCAQSSNGYLSRNSKFHRNQKASSQKESKVKPAEQSGESSLYVNSYRSRNEKFHKHNSPKTKVSKPSKNMAYYDPSHVEKRQKKIAGHNSTGAKLTKFLTFILLVGILVPK